MIELLNGSNVILATPTGSGISIVAIAAQLHGDGRGAGGVYTAPVKALVSEKLFALCETLGARERRDADEIMGTGPAALTELLMSTAHRPTPTVAPGSHER